jgi:hypothetical protein
MKPQKLDARRAQLAAMSFDRAKFEVACAEIRRAIDEALALSRSRGCYDRSFSPIVKPPPFLIGDYKQTKVFERYLGMFMDMHADHNKRCVRCGHDKRQRNENRRDHEEASGRRTAQA